MAKAMGKTLDKEMAQFQTDLLQSVRQMKAGKAARNSVVTLTPAAEARTKVGVSQADFALNRCLDHLGRGNAEDKFCMMPWEKRNRKERAIYEQAS